MNIPGGAANPARSVAVYAQGKVHTTQASPDPILRAWSSTGASDDSGPHQCGTEAILTLTSRTMPIRMPSASYPRQFGFASCCALCVSLSACDPVYRVGARQTLNGTEAMAPQAASPNSNSSGPAVVRPLDVPTTADCLEAALRESSNLSDIKRWQTASHLRLREAGMSFAVADSSMRGGHRYANVTLKTEREQPAAVELTFGWRGNARTIPLGEQRRMITLATGLLRGIRDRCLPQAKGDVECVADGLGGNAACGIGA